MALALNLDHYGNPPNTGQNLEGLSAGLSLQHNAYASRSNSPALYPPRGPVEDLQLSELMKNPHVSKLYDNFLEATTSQVGLCKEVRELRASLEALRAKNASLRNQGM